MGAGETAACKTFGEAGCACCHKLCFVRIPGSARRQEGEEGRARTSSERSRYITQQSLGNTSRLSSSAKGAPVGQVSVQPPALSLPSTDTAHAQSGVPGESSHGAENGQYSLLANLKRGVRTGSELWLCAVRRAGSSQGLSKAETGRTS